MNLKLFICSCYNPTENQYQFLIFAPSEEAARKYCENYIAEEKELEKNRIESYGGEGNYLWANHKIEQVAVKDFHGCDVTAIWLN